MNKINLSVIDNLAVSLEAPQKGEVVYELKLSEIIPDPDQPRKERHREEDNNLADSIQSEGVIQPILVRPKSESGDYMIICGERRYDASIQAGLNHPNDHSGGWFVLDFDRSDGRKHTAG